MLSLQDTYDMDHELPNVIFALGSHLMELAGLIIIISIYQVYFLVGAVRLSPSQAFSGMSGLHESCCL